MYSSKKLKELVYIAPKSKYSAYDISNMQKGNTKCFTSGSNTYFVNKELVNGEYLFINDGGVADIKYHNGSACYTDHVFALKVNDICCNGTYLYYFLLSKIEEINNNMFVGLGLKNLVKSDFLNIYIVLPDRKTQDRIASILSEIDNKINSEDKFISKLKEIKQSLLELLFPSNNSNYPQLRFKNFASPWEQRKLGDDLVSIHTGTNLLGSITNTGMPLIKMGNIQRGYFDTSKVEFLAENEQPDKADIVNYGDFFFNTRNTLELVGKGATWMKNSGEYAFNSNIARFELRNLDTIFFNYLYNTDYMTKQIHARAMGTTSVAAIYPRTLDSVEYLAPCMKEQQKIGAYFKHLDDLITLHQCKCI